MASPSLSRRKPVRGAPPVRHDEVEARVLDRHKARMRLLLEDARDMALLLESRHYLLLKCSSIREYGEREVGMSAGEATELAAIGRSLRAFPELEGLLLDARVTAEGAAILAKIADHQDVVKPEDTWISWAEAEPAKTFRKRVNRRLREAEKPMPPRTVTLLLEEEAREDLEKAVVLSSRSERDLLTPSAAVATALRHYVKSKDVLEKEPGQRRLPVTGDGLTRTVPADVKRTMHRRAGGKCRLPFCENDVFVDGVHVFEDFADGGPQEEWNMDLHCKPHHGMQGRGEIVNRGTTKDPEFWDSEGRPLFVRRAVRMSRTAPRAPEARTAPRPTPEPSGLLLATTGPP